LKSPKAKSRLNPRAFSDAGLISEYIKSNDSLYVGELFERYTHLVFGVCLKYLKNEEDSKDAVMQIFEKLLSDLKEHEISNFKSWLYSVAKNHCLMSFRKEKVATKAKDGLKEEIEFDFMEFPVEPHLNNEALNNDKSQILQNAINLLNERQKICVELFYLKEKSYNEVAEITGYSLKEVKSSIQNGKRNLKNYLMSKNES